MRHFPRSLIGPRHNSLARTPLAFSAPLEEASNCVKFLPFHDQYIRLAECRASTSLQLASNDTELIRCFIHIALECLVIIEMIKRSGDGRLFSLSDSSPVERIGRGNDGRFGRASFLECQLQRGYLMTFEKDRAYRSLLSTVCSPRVPALCAMDIKKENFWRESTLAVIVAAALPGCGKKSCPIEMCPDVCPRALYY